MGERRRCGLFYCLRVRDGLIEDSIFEDNSGHGVSIGDRDTGHINRRLVIRHNGGAGIFLRQCGAATAPHANSIIDCRLEENAARDGEAEIVLQGRAEGVCVVGNHMRNLMLIIGLLAWASISTAAELPGATNLTLTAALDLAVRNNAGLQSLRAKWEAMQERPAQAGALANPMFTYSGMDMASGGTWPNTGEKRFMIQQEFPWAGKRGLREGIAIKDAEVMQRELETMSRDVALMVKESYFDLYAVQRVIAITREEEEVIRRIVKVTETMYATGERSQVDVLKAQSEITMLKQKLLETQAQENTLKARLNTLMNRHADTLIGTMATSPKTGFGDNMERLYAMAATNRPEIQAAQSQIERYELEKKLMSRESAPDYKLGLEYRDIEASDNMVMFTISVDLPIRRAKYRAGIREAEKMRSSSQAAREAAERQSVLDVQDAHFKLVTAQRTLDLYRTELIPQAITRYNASEAGYRTGKLDFMDMLESERFLLSAKVMAAMAEGALGMQAARLERALGTSMPANSLTEENTQ